MNRIELMEYLLNKLNVLIKGNQEVLEMMKLFPSEKGFYRDLKKTVTEQKQVRRRLRVLLKRKEVYNDCN